MLPRDCVLLPLTDGALIVSRDHATFCCIPPGEVDTARAVIAGDIAVEALSPPLRANLERHGFFGSPRPSRRDTPSVQLQLTNACNLACAYCCTNSGGPRAAEASYEQMLDVVRQIPATLGPKTAVALLGGEPLLVPWALNLADDIVQLGLPLTIFTNGILLNDNALAARTAQLVQDGVLVRVSLGGPNRATCDTISGARRFEAALRGIHNLAMHGGQATVDLMFMPQHVDAIASELAQLRRRLPPHTPLTFGVLYMSGRETGAHLFPGRAALDDALDQVAFGAGEAIPVAEIAPVTHRREGCGCALGQHVHVRSDGALFNCFKMEEQVGQLDADGFAAAAQSIREHPHRVGDLPTCATCPLATLCGGGCRSENLLYTGDADVPPCGPWRVRVLSELLAEGRITAVEWSVAFLLHEARRRGIETPDLRPQHPSRHLVDV